MAEPEPYRSSRIALTWYTSSEALEGREEEKTVLLDLVLRKKEARMGSEGVGTTLSRERFVVGDVNVQLNTCRERIARALFLVGAPGDYQPFQNEISDFILKQAVRPWSRFTKTLVIVASITLVTLQAHPPAALSLHLFDLECRRSAFRLASDNSDDVQDSLRMHHRGGDDFEIVAVSRGVHVLWRSTIRIEGGVEEISGGGDDTDLHDASMVVAVPAINSNYSDHDGHDMHVRRGPEPLLIDEMGRVHAVNNNNDINSDDGDGDHDDVLRESFSFYEQMGFRAVPATEAAIEASLNTLNFEQGMADLNRTCTVCLDGFIDGMQLKRMPCMHLFHEDCVVTWLKQSNSCPICRFKLRDHEDS